MQPGLFIIDKNVSLLKQLVYPLGLNQFRYWRPEAFAAFRAFSSDAIHGFLH